MKFVEKKNSKYKKILDETKNEPRYGMHSFHRYYGKLIPAIPRAYIRQFTEINDTIFDPFNGSGTVALESKQLDRNFIGVEINPLSVLITKAKTNNYDFTTLEKLYTNLKELVYNDHNDINESDIPFCVNRDHWFKDFVQKELVIIERNIPIAITNTKIKKKEQEKYRIFLYGVLSAIVKQVSNADTMHVFPGISKRMRRLEAEGKINIKVFDTFFRGLKKRISYVKELNINDSDVKVLLGDSSKINLTEYKNSVDLIVTNPPYISSVRYAETLKLELYWMRIIQSSEEYVELSESMIGNDKFNKSQYIDLQLTGHEYVDGYIKDMYKIDKKQAKVLYDYFTLMENVIKQMALVLKKGKKVVMKISDSKIRKTKIPTGKLLSYIAEDNGFKFVEVFNDKINENSRSLLTARNTYSDIILEDNIIFWEKL